MKILFFYFFIFLSTQIIANDYYDELYLGESDFSEYSGPFRPDFIFEDITGNIIFSDNIFYNSFFSKSINQELFDLEKLFFKKFPIKSTCPDYYLSSSITYIRYLFRLVTISYLYEGIKDYNKGLYYLRENASTCSLNWKSIFQKCRPVSQE